MPGLLRSDDIHHAANAMIAALASEITAIDGDISGVLTRNRNPMGGTATADKRIAEAPCDQ